MKLIKRIRSVLDIILFGGNTSAQKYHNTVIKAIDKALEKNKEAIQNLDNYKQILIDQITELQEEVANIEDTAAILEQKQNNLTLAQKALVPVIEVESSSNAKV